MTSLARSRFRTSDGDRAPVAAWRDFPCCAGQWLAAKISRHRPALPWIPYPAIRYLAQCVRPDWHVLEIGAGMSTLWFAKRCARVTSYEADRVWFERLNGCLVEQRIGNVHLEHRWVAASMCDFSAIRDQSLDLAFIDGGPRLDCARASIPKVKPGGLLYVDNTDDATSAWSTKRFLQQRAADTGETLTIVRGFPPATLFINEGAFLQLGA